jgi:transcriptional regulator with XRE-family HTH domain
MMKRVYNVRTERGNKMKRAELKAFRTSKGLTQKDVAEMLGVSTSHYACIEQGTHNPSTKLVKVFCNVFGKENASLIIGS